jgi:hypothetical protein
LHFIWSASGTTWSAVTAPQALADLAELGEISRRLWNRLQGDNRKP